jgi:hypothetical protein
MADTSTIQVRLDPKLSPEFQALLGTATEDTLEKLAAGAQLVYALYHSGAETIRSLPDPVTRAYVRACAAYGVGHRRQAHEIRAGEITEVPAGDTTDPVRMVEG